MDFIKELWMFMRLRKKYWLIPIVIIMLLFATLIIFTQGTTAGPFVYSLF